MHMNGGFPEKAGVSQGGFSSSFSSSPLASGYRGAQEGRTTSHAISAGPGEPLPAQPMC